MAQREYSENLKTAFITRTKTYEAEDGTKGTETEIYKRVYGGKHFWRVWLDDLLTALGLISNSRQLDVVFHVLDHTDQATNLYIGTLRKTAADTGISLGTIAATFKKMQEVKMITKQQNGVYFVNPSLLMTGSNSKKQRLVINYERIEKENARDCKENQETVLADSDGLTAEIA